MRSSLRVLIVALVAAVGVVAGAIPGGGAELPQMNTVQVVKDVTGDAPSGTVFVIRIACENLAGPSAAAPPFAYDVSFNEDGVPLDPSSTFALPAHSRCTVTETADGGASATSYGCAIKHKAMNEEPPFEGNCTGDNEVTFNNVVDDRATLTVYNTFPIGQTPESDPPITPAAQAVQAAPAFTG